MDPRSVIVVIGITSAIVTCAPSHARRPADIKVTGSCPPIPASWPQSTLRRSLGSSDLTLRPQTGALFVEVKGDGLNPSALGAHLALRSRAILRDTVVRDSVVNIALLPPGRYSLRIRRLGFRQLQDSIEIRSGYLDTVRVVLATDMACLEHGLRTAERLWEPVV
jgi:hypothetical protein